MTATLEDVLADVATRARVKDVKESFDFAPPQFAPVAPCVVVEPDDGDFLAYDPSMGSESVDYLLKLTVYVQGDDKAAQKQLFAFLRPSGEYSIRAAVAGRNATLAVSYAVLRASNPRVAVGEGDTRYLAAEISVRVTA